MAPRTVELNPVDFERACAQLVDEVAAFRPDVVVGIATGGVHVARAMAPHFEERPDLAEVVLRRPSTGVKERAGVGRVLSRLPTGMANTLRWLEVEAREAGLRRSDPEADAMPMIEASPAPGPELGARLAVAERVLVVDDTVDSGRTLVAATILARRAGAAPERIRTAVLTSTFRKPPVRPDYCLYERTLLRFPWSFDS